MKLSVLGLLLISSISATPAPERVHAVFGEILQRYVDGERIDYARLRDEDRGSLEEYLRRLGSHGVERLPREDQLAFYINLYNATMIKAVVDRYRPGWTPAADDFAVFKEPLVQLGSRRISLNELEHEIIRKQFKDARIHAALVCAARSCPPLLPRAYRGDDLDRVLDENMKRFVADRTRNPIDDEKRQLRLSKIFEWYADDFGGTEKLAEYVGDVAGKDYSGYAVSFVEYSWELNDVER